MSIFEGHANGCVIRRMAKGSTATVAIAPPNRYKAFR
jgi:hypothetical protein